MSYPQRTRHRPGPRLLITLACLFLASTVLRAHDPGLSALDVHVNERVTMSLSIAAADAAALVPGRGDMRQALSEIARDAIQLSIDGEAVQPGAHDVTMDDGGAQVRWSFAIPPARGRVRQLAIASDVRKRMRAVIVSSWSSRWVRAWSHSASSTQSRGPQSSISKRRHPPWPAPHGIFSSSASITSCPATTISSSSQGCYWQSGQYASCSSR